jgi:hypothetical protein
MSGMPGVLDDYLILFWAALSILATGIALCRRFTPLQGIELVGYGAGAGVVVHGLFGLLIALDRHLRHYVGILAICSAACAVAYLIRRRIWRELAGTLSRPLQVVLALWLLFLIFCVALPRINIAWPAALPDGQYVFKDHTLNVKIQYLTALPADNAIPHLVTEFFLRNISFKKEHPILPNNEVSNRTILMSLVALPFRAVLGWNQRGEGELGTYGYLGKEWPAVEKLNDEKSLHHSFVIGVFLNSLMLLGLVVLFSNFELAQNLPFAALLYVTNPYFFGQTIFTWPKAMAGFFILLCWNSLRRNYQAWIVAALAAAAYHCHPASLAMAGGIALYYAITYWRAKSSIKPLLTFAAVFLLILLPWLIWTRLVLELPDNLLAQNISREGAPHLISAPVDFVWVRFFNIVTNLFPVSLIVYPFDLDKVISYATYVAPTAIGLFLFIPAFLECVHRWNSDRTLLLYGMLLPALAIVLVFSIPAQPVLFGWQPIVGALLFLGVLRLRRDFSPFAYWSLILAQLICNLTVLALRGYLVGARLG